MVKPALLFMLGVALGAIVAGCASEPVFTYHHYDLDLEHEKLLGPAVVDDLDLSVCKVDPLKPTAHPCYVVMAPVWHQLEADDEKLQVDLSRCQAGPVPHP